MSSNVIEAREQPAPVEQELEASPDQATIEEDLAQSGGDADSALGTDAASSTMSVLSCYLNYRCAHGRTYHAEIGNAQYWRCNDEPQNEVLDLFHHIFRRVASNKLFHAPIARNDMKKVLDVGTGTGIWAIDVADEFPEAQVMATDISPIQPDFLPPNLANFIEDCTSVWSWPDDCFDLVHIRCLNGSVKSWETLFKDAYRCVKPGGYVESCELSVRIESDDGSVTKNSCMYRWGELFTDAAKVLGRSFTVIEDDLQRKGMEEAGFVDIQEKEFKIPLGIWPAEPVMKEIGILMLAAMVSDLEGFALDVATSIKGWSKETTFVYTALLRREMLNRHNHGYCRQKVVWGQKPK